MKILVLGGAGQVAQAVAAAAPERHTVVVRSRQELDIGDEAAVAAEVGATGAQWIVNGAAYTAVDRAESEPAAAQLANETAVGCIARVSAAARCRLLHLSTDFVFDGAANRAYRPTDPTNPLSVYGHSKLGGERQIEASGAAAIILRTAWVYASTGRNFALTMLRLMREKNEVRVVSDQIGTPSWAPGIARCIWGLIDADVAGGIYHWTDLGLASWYDFAVAIQDEARARGLLERAVPVIPISTAQFPTPAKRPAFSVLNTEATREALPGVARHWRHNLGSMLDELGGR